MRESLADDLNLTGTARHNLAMRNKIRLARMTEERRKMPAVWEEALSFCNHSELACINRLAVAAGCEVPFAHVEPLIADTGERFFSEHLSWIKEARPKQNENDLCLCDRCFGNLGDSRPKIMHSPPVPPINNHTNAMSNVATLPNLPAQTQQPPLAMMQQPQLQFNPLWIYPPPPQMCWPPAFCCQVYQEHCLRTGKKGRPPHAKDCGNRNKRLVAM